VWSQLDQGALLKLTPRRPPAPILTSCLRPVRPLPCGRPLLNRGATVIPHLTFRLSKVRWHQTTCFHRSRRLQWFRGLSSGWQCRVILSFCCGKFCCFSKHIFSFELLTFGFIFDPLFRLSRERSVLQWPWVRSVLDSTHTFLFNFTYALIVISLPTCLLTRSWKLWSAKWCLNCHK